jgi:hypothetical protein
MSTASAWAAVAAAEAVGIQLRLNGDRIQARLPDGDNRHLSEILDRLRINREQVAAVIRERAKVPPMPPHTRLVNWNPIAPPVMIENYSIVVDVPLFIRSTLGQLGVLLGDGKRRVGWTVPQILDRLRQVGVVVEIDKPSPTSDRS